MAAAHLRPLYPYVKKYRSAYIWGGISVIAMNSIWALFPIAVGRGIDSLKNSTVTPALMHKIGVIAVTLLIIAASKAIFQFLTRRVVIGASREIEFDLRNDLFRHLESLSYSFYHRTRTGDSMAKSTNDLNAVRMLLGPGIMYTANAIVF